MNIPPIETKVKLSKNIIFLYINRLLIQTAFGLLTGFSVLFFYEKFGNSIYKTLLMYAVLYSVFMVTYHFAASLLNKIGMRKMMIIAILGLATMLLSRVFWDYSPLIILATYIISSSIYKSLYWIPYHIEFASFTDYKNRGKQVAFLYNIGAILASLLPFIGGYILTIRGYNTLFIIGVVFALLSIIPLFKIQETHEKYTWSLKRLISEIFQEENRPIVASTIGNGMQTTIAAIIWPIFIFITIQNNYLKFGFILAIVAITMVGLRWLIGTVIDKFGRSKVLKIGNTLYVTGWLFKIFIESAFGIFIVDVYHNLGGVINSLSYSVSVYDQAADNGHYIDEFTVLTEVTFILGQILMTLLVIPMIFFFSLKITFILGALAAMLMVSISKAQKVN